jgi:hypothetical protein
MINLIGEADISALLREDILALRVHLFVAECVLWNVTVNPNDAARMI